MQVYKSTCAETEYWSYPWGETCTVTTLINLQNFSNTAMFWDENNDQDYAYMYWEVIIEQS